jgi:lysozyme
MNQSLKTHLQHCLLFACLLLLLLGWWLSVAFKRQEIAALTLSATALIAIVFHEGYRENAYIPVPGDVPTIGFGTTQGVKLGDKTDPISALSTAHRDIKTFEGAIKACVTVPLYQWEYDAYTSLAYNIGGSAFCRSTLVRLLNQEKYEEACKQILRWNKFKGQTLKGLTKRRQEEYRMCINA